jgi:cystathionine gamma-lyase
MDLTLSHNCWISTIFNVGLVGDSIQIILTLLLKSGDEVVCIDDVYGGTQRLFRQVIQPTSNINFHFFDLCSDNLDEFDKLKNLISDPNSKVKMIWIESPTNPTLKMVDIQQLCDSVRSIAPDRDIIITVDNTFMSPHFQNP